MTVYVATILKSFLF